MFWSTKVKEKFFFYLTADIIALDISVYPVSVSR